MTLPHHELKYEAPRCVAATGDRCGEGVVWHPGHNALYWTDINRFLIHRYRLVDETVVTWFFHEPATSLALTSDDETIVVVLSSRVLLWKPLTDTRSEFGFELPGFPKVRCNDARVDPRGSLWVGTMRNNVNPDGSAGDAEGEDGILYRIDPNGKVTKWERDIRIANTMIWNRRRDRFYSANTLANTISRYNYDTDTGAISAKTPHFVDYSRGLPDGSAIDEHDCIWNCRHGGQCIVRICPDGRLDQVIEMPVTNPTNCTFGGPDRSTLFVTSASLDSGPEDRLGGCLFSLKTNTHGLAENRFKLVRS